MNIFGILSAFIGLYTLLCFIRVILTWFPGAEYSSFGKALATICDPYLHIFKKATFLRFSAFDFTPAIALCILTALSTIFSSLSRGSYITIGNILAMLISMCWSIINSILLFIAAILVIRLIVYFVSNRNSNSYSIWNSVDRAITPLIYKITGTFFRGRTQPFHTAIIISIVSIVLIMFVGKIIVTIVCAVLSALPF